MKPQLIFPIAIIKDKDPGIYVCEENDFGLVSKGGEKFYNRGSIYGSDGNKYNILNIELVKKAPFITSIKYFQPMFIVDINTQLNEHVDFSDFQKIISHIDDNSNYFLSMMPVDDLRHSIMEKNNYKEILTMFK